MFATKTKSDPLTVFIVDDSDLLRQNLSEMLSEIDGTQIIGEAADGVEAIAKIQEVGPDLVILDIRLPGADGFEVLRAIKQYRPSIQIMMFTSHTQDQYAQKSFALGADYFFEKSGKFIDLLDQVESMARLKFQ